MPETYTRAELVTEAANNLLLIGSGQSLEAEDADKIDGKVDSMVEQLQADEIVDIPDLAEIEARYFDALAQLLANSCSSTFGIPFDPQKKLGFEGLLRRTAASRPTYETLRTDYF